MSIQLSPQHGVNPSVEQCFVCMKDVGVVLFGRMRGDAEAPRKVCLPNREPCDECKGYMDQGVILISVDESKTDDPQNPWRSVASRPSMLPMSATIIGSTPRPISINDIPARSSRGRRTK